MWHSLVLAALPYLAAGQPTAPATTVAAGDECTCANGAVLNGQCFPDLASAIAKSTGQDTVYVVGTSYVKAPIHFGWDLNLVGIECSGQRCGN
jgi:hypothetical protein